MIVAPDLTLIPTIFIALRSMIISTSTPSRRENGRMSSNPQMHWPVVSILEKQRSQQRDHTEYDSLIENFYSDEVVHKQIQYHQHKSWEFL